MVRSHANRRLGMAGLVVALAAFTASTGCGSSDCVAGCDNRKKCGIETRDCSTVCASSEKEAEVEGCVAEADAFDACWAGSDGCHPVACSNPAKKLAACVNAFCAVHPQASMCGGH